MRPLIVVESPGEPLEAAVREVEGDGWRIHRGFDFGRNSWGVEGAGVVCAGTVETADDAEAALLAAARGAGLVVASAAGRPLVERLFENLRRLGPVELRRADANPLGSLDAEQRRLLALLAQGSSIAEAGRALGYSKRTIDRRLADARRALGVETTAEALALARDAGR